MASLSLMVSRDSAASGCPWKKISSATSSLQLVRHGGEVTGIVEYSPGWKGSRLAESLPGFNYYKMNAGSRTAIGQGIGIVCTGINYASFPEHGHPPAKEILLLDGIFSDESGDYSAGTYFRKPHMGQHTPFVEAETLIWGKAG